MKPSNLSGGLNRPASPLRICSEIPCGGPLRRTRGEPRFTVGVDGGRRRFRGAHRGLFANLQINLTKGWCQRGRQVCRADRESTSANQRMGESAKRTTSRETLSLIRLIRQFADFDFRSAGTHRADPGWIVHTRKNHPSGTSSETLWAWSLIEFYLGDGVPPCVFMGRRRHCLRLPTTHRNGFDKPLVTSSGLSDRKIKSA